MSVYLPCSNTTYALAEGETVEKLQNDEPEKAVASKETYLQAIAESTPIEFLLHHSLIGGCLSFTELSNYAKVDVKKIFHDGKQNMDRSKRCWFLNPNSDIDYYVEKRIKVDGKSVTVKKDSSKRRSQHFLLSHANGSHLKFLRLSKKSSKS